jgi:hypothetical protein
MNRTALSLLLVLSSVGASAQSSEEYAQMGQATWSAFECSALAAHLKNSKEQERLFQFGLSQGKAFIEAVQSGKVKKEDLSKGVPIGLLWLLEGPSPDFMLGRIFESAMDHALDDVFKTKDRINDDAVQQLLAADKFRASNCQLVGAAR